MIPVPPDQIKEFLLKATDDVLKRACQSYTLNGFGFVFDVLADEPAFHFAINTRENGPATGWTGDWDFPAGGFDGDELAPNWRACYAKLHDYLAADDDAESRFTEIHEMFCAAMKQVRKQWQHRLPDCVFTVNECNDCEQLILEIFEDINDIRERPSKAKRPRG